MVKHFPVCEVSAAVRVLHCQSTCQTVFTQFQDVICLLHRFDIHIIDAEAVVGKIADALA